MKMNFHTEIRQKYKAKNKNFNLKLNDGHLSKKKCRRKQKSDQIFSKISHAETEIGRTPETEICRKLKYQKTEMRKLNSRNA